MFCSPTSSSSTSSSSYWKVCMTATFWGVVLFKIPAVIWRWRNGLSAALRHRFSNPTFATPHIWNIYGNLHSVFTALFTPVWLFCRSARSPSATDISSRQLIREALEGGWWCGVGRSTMRPWAFKQTDRWSKWWTIEVNDLGWVFIKFDGHYNIVNARTNPLTDKPSYRDARTPYFKKVSRDNQL